MNINTNPENGISDVEFAIEGVEARITFNPDKASVVGHAIGCC
jgi:hypothetical protein